MKVATILGTRPEIIKLSALIPLLDKSIGNENHILIHTGQHYDYRMDKIFFDELRLRRPLERHQLNLGSSSFKNLSAVKKTSKMMELIEDVLIKEKPAVVIVQGDTNTAFAAAFAAHDLSIKIAHVESGCRSFNSKQPEERNRKFVDHMADFLFAPDEESVTHLQREGIPSEKIFHVGNTTVDVLLRNKKLAENSTIIQNLNTKYSLNLQEHHYVVVTIHRVEVTENKNHLQNIILALNSISNKIEVLFPLHPRTAAALERFGLKAEFEAMTKVHIIEPLSYLEFLKLLSNSRFCISDSGGVQEEAALLNVPCIIPRNETEWMRFVDEKKNMLAGIETKTIVHAAESLLNDDNLAKAQSKLDCLQGASEKIVKKIIDILKEVNQ